MYYNQYDSTPSHVILPSHLKGRGEGGRGGMAECHILLENQPAGGSKKSQWCFHPAESMNVWMYGSIPASKMCGLAAVHLLYGILNQKIFGFYPKILQNGVYFSHCNIFNCLFFGKWCSAVISKVQNKAYSL